MDDQNISTNKRPQPRTSPIVDSFTGDIGFSIEGISDHHMPLKYEDFECTIDLLKIDMVNFQNLKLKLIFTINGDLENLRKLYDGGKRGGKGSGTFFSGNNIFYRTGQLPYFTQ
ncbi:MAG: hypothetical protein HW401_278 [Parcubacteria group bacterium]|nr:hypothetical protein [Parcubacteria group bacterium]